MPERPIAASNTDFHIYRLPDGALDARRGVSWEADPEQDQFLIDVGAGRNPAIDCDISIHVVCSIGQLEHLQTSIDALLQDRSRALGPPDAIESVVTDEDGAQF